MHKRNDGFLTELLTLYSAHYTLLLTKKFVKKNFQDLFEQLTQKIEELLIYIWLKIQKLFITLPLALAFALQQTMTNRNQRLDFKFQVKMSYVGNCDSIEVF